MKQSVVLFAVTLCVQDSLLTLFFILSNTAPQPHHTFLSFCFVVNFTKSFR